MGLPLQVDKIALAQLDSPVAGLPRGGGSLRMLIVDSGSYFGELRRASMSRALILGSVLLGSVLLATINASWAAQGTSAAAKPNPSYPRDSQITFQWNYSCPSSRGCSFSCPGTAGADHVTKLDIYLGSVPIGTQRSPAIFYNFSTYEVPRGNGFSINTGLGTLSCQVNGMSLDYSGPPENCLDP